ncbi:MAG: hypothetical protein ACP5SI_00785 [Chloroflexia bacterium]
MEELRAGVMVCPWCDFHFPWEASLRQEWLVDEGSFEMLSDLPPSPNQVGRATLAGQPVAVVVTDHTCGWSTEDARALVRIAETAFLERRPLLWVLSAPQGGPDAAGLWACWAAFSRLAERKVPRIVLIAGACFGPLAALALQADLLFAEPGAVLGPLLPEALRQAGRLPPECAEPPRRLLRAGWADVVVGRREQRAVLAMALDLLGSGGRRASLPLPGGQRGLLWNLPAPLGGSFGPVLEIHGDRGSADPPSLRAGIARLRKDGPTVLLLGAALGNRSLFSSGRHRAIGVAGWRKAARLVRFASRFDLPVIGLVGAAILRPDSHEGPGALAGALGDFQGAWYGSEVPTVTVFLRRPDSLAVQAFEGADRLFVAAEAAEGMAADAVFEDEEALSALLAEGVEELVQTYLLSGPLGRRKLLQRRAARLLRALPQGTTSA